MDEKNSLFDVKNQVHKLTALSLSLCPSLYPTLQTYRI